MKTHTFFSPDGISSSDANFLAELAKTRNTKLVARIDNAAAYMVTVNFNGSPVIIENPAPIDILSVVHIADLYALSAWLREAIKAKNELIDWVKVVEDTHFGEHPVFTPIPLKHYAAPAAPKEPTEEEAISTFSVDELAEYYKLEAYAAHIGKRIHPGGAVYKLIEDTAAHKERTSEFHQIDGVSYVKTFAPVYTDESLAPGMEELRVAQNEFQRKLNWYKARIQNWITQTKARRMSEHRAEIEAKQAEVNKHNQAARENLEAYSSALAAAKADNERKRAEKLKEISTYKILIPATLQPVYQLLKKSPEAGS